MATNYGKAFEKKFSEDWAKTMPNSSLDRLYDVTLGFKSISQVSDYIGYKKPTIFFIELKTHKGASIPLENITQYDKMLKKVGIPGVRSGVILWLYEKDIVVYIPISTIKLLKESGEKSVGIRHLDKYNIKKIPSVKKRIFMDSDYSCLMDLSDGE